MAEGSVSTGHGRPGPRPDVEVAPTVRVAAGTRSAIHVRVTNRSAAPRILAVAALGVDPAWLSPPVRTTALAPGASEDVLLEVVPPAGTLPASYPMAVAAQPIDPATGRTPPAEQVTGLAEATLVVNPRARVSVELEPGELTAVSSRRFAVVLRNSGRAGAEVRLSAVDPRHGRVRLRRQVVQVPPDGEVRVAARARLNRPRIVGYGSRHGFTVTATSQESSRTAEGGLTQRTLVGPAGLKLVALAAVLVVWLAAAVVLVPQLSERVRQSAEEEATGQSDGGAGADGTAGDADGDGTPDAEESGGGAGGEGGGGGPGAGGGDEAEGMQLAGTVVGDDPDGVTVTLDPRSLVDEEMQGRGIGVDDSEFDSPSLRPVAAFTTVAPEEARPAQREQTGDDGAWSFSGVVAPGYYLLTFAKPGYQTQRFVVDSTSEAAKTPLEVELVPGEGELSGRITGPDGRPYGGATVTITDGTTSITTSSTSVGGDGAVGSWRVTGLSTPSTYVVTATAHDMSTEARSVSLAAEGEASADLQLQSGVALVRGTAVRMGGNGHPKGLGGVTVSVGDGDDVVRSATSLTEGSTGMFFVPGIPAPGTYVVTLSAAGYEPVSTRIKLEQGQSTVRLGDVTLSTSTGQLIGRVVGVPDADSVARASTSAVRSATKNVPLAATGLRLSSNSATYKTTSSTPENSAGKSSFEFNGIAPGVYTLSADYFGYEAWNRIVRVDPGTDSSGTVVSLTPRVGGEQPSTASVIGSAVSAGAAGTELTCTDECLTATLRTTIPGTSTRCSYTDTFPADGAYQLPAPGTHECGTAPGATAGLLAGHYTVTVSSPGYVARAVPVDVAEARQTTAPVAELVPVPAVTGTITLADVDGAPNPEPVPDTCVWVETTGTASSTHTVQECLTAIERGRVVPGETTGPDLDPRACTAGGHDNTGASEEGRTTWCAALLDGASTYRVEVPEEGAHTITVVSTDLEYRPVSPPTALGLQQGTQTYDVRLQRLGRVRLTVKRPAATPGDTEDPSDTLVPAAGVTPTVSPMPATAQVRPSGADGVSVVTGLPAGTYTVSGAGQETSGQVNVTAAVNSTTSATLALVNRIRSLTARVRGTAEGATVDIAGARVSFDGATAFDGAGHGAAYQRVEATTQARGCVGVRITVEPTAADCGTFPAGSRATADFVTSTMRSIEVSASGWETRTFRKRVLDPAVVHDLELYPSLVDVDLPVTVLPAGSPLVASEVRVTVTGRSVTAGVEGTPGAYGLTWVDAGRYPGDTTAALGGAVPGTYTVTVRAPGFAPITRTVECGFGEGRCTVDQPFELSRLGSVRLQVLGGDGTVPIAGVEVTAALADGSDDGVLHATRLSDRTGEVLLDDLVAGTDADPDTDYVVVVRAPGHEDGTSDLTPSASDPVRLRCPSASSSARISVTPGATATCDLVLTPAGVVQGTLRAVYDLPGDPATTVELLTGRRVTARRCLSVDGGWCTALAEGPGFSGVTDDAGEFTLHGTIEQDMVAGPWLLTAPTAPGFDPLTPGPGAPAGALPGTLVDVSATLTAGVEVDHFARPTDLTIEVTDGYHPLTDVTVSLVRPSDGVAVSRVTAVAQGSGDELTYRIDRAVPGYWWIDVQGSGVAQGTRQSVYLAPDSSGNTARVVIARVHGAVRGDVADDGSDLRVPNAQVTLTCVVPGTVLCPPSGPALSVTHDELVTTTDAQGAFHLDGVASGDYRLVVAAEGYADDDAASRDDVRVTNAEVSVSVRLTATMRQLSTQVTGTGSAGLAAATVVLTPVGQTPGTAQSATVGTPLQLRPGCYRAELVRPDRFHAGVGTPVLTVGGSPPPDDPALDCGGAVEVARTQTEPLTLTWSSDAVLLDYSYTATPQDGHVAPTAALAVTGASAFTVPDAAGGSIWVDPGSYRIEPVLPVADRAWWEVTAASGTAGVDTLAVGATERSTTLEVSVAGLEAGEQATVYLSPGPGQTGIVQVVSGTVGPGESFRFTVPRGAWVVEGSWPHGPDAQVVSISEVRTYTVVLQPDPASYPRSTPADPPADPPAPPSDPAAPPADTPGDTPADTPGGPGDGAAGGPGADGSG